jgi:nitrate reductase gamma subunit
VIRSWHLLSLTKAYQVDNSIDFGPPRKPQAKSKFSLDDLPELIEKLKLTVLGTSPVTIIVSFIFHCCLIIVPLFLLAHNILIEDAIGFSLFSFSEKTTDGLTVVFLLCGLYFLTRRLFLPRVRAITTFYDFVILSITVAPFLTGFLAYYQLFDYRTIIILHMLAGELMLVAIPFTKVFHMIFFFVGRFVLVNQHTIGRGSRTW